MSLLKIIARKMGAKKARKFADKSTGDQLKELKGRMKSCDQHADKTKEGYETLIRAGLKGSGDKAEALKKTYGA
jgi:hypothetical protein